MLKMLLIIYCSISGSLPFKATISSPFFLKFCNRSEPDDFYILMKKGEYMAFLYYNLHFVNNINIYAMHILCLNKTNDVANLPVFTFSKDHFEQCAPS